MRRRSSERSQGSAPGRVAKRRGAFAGVGAAAVSLSVTELVGVTVSNGRTLIVGIGTHLIDQTAGWLKEPAVGLIAGLTTPLTSTAAVVLSAVLGAVTGMGDVAGPSSRSRRRLAERLPPSLPRHRCRRSTQCLAAPSSSPPAQPASARSRLLGSPGWCAPSGRRTVGPATSRCLRSPPRRRCHRRTRSPCRVSAPTSPERRRPGSPPCGRLVRLRVGDEVVERDPAHPPRGLRRLLGRSDARLGDATSDNTWVQWVWDWDAAPGQHVLRVRATDGLGVTQTRRRQAVLPDGATGYHARAVQVTERSRWSKPTRSGVQWR